MSDEPEEVIEEESNMPLGSVALIPCARHHHLQHRHEVIDDPEQPGVGKLWHCIDTDPEHEHLEVIEYERLEIKERAYRLGDFAPGDMEMERNPPTPLGGIVPGPRRHSVKRPGAE